MSPKNSYLVAKSVVKARYLKSKSPIAIGFDITNRCNLRCPQCYWWADNKSSQLPVEDIVQIVQDAVREGVIHATWVGGEPLLCPEVLEQVTSIVPINWIVTNGTMPLRSFPNTTFLVSIDGTEHIHAQVRRPGLYQLLKENLKGKPVLINTTLFRLNKDEPQKLVEDWIGSGVKGITFNFATKMGGTNDSFYLTDDERDRTVDDLHALLDKYPKFVFMTHAWLEKMKAGAASERASRCQKELMGVYTRAYASDGSLKLPCILGRNAVCSSCGCHVPIVLESITGARQGADFVSAVRVLARLL